MLTTLLAFAVVAPSAQDTQDAVSAPELVSRMIAYYYGAQTMTGTINLTVKAGPDTSSVATTLQYERPGKLYIRQQKSTGNRQMWLTVSDGKTFAYNAPITPVNSNPNKRLVETMEVEGLKMTIEHVYAAASVTLGDRCAPLDIAIGRRADLDYFRNQLATVEYKGSVSHEGQSVHVVMGDWRPYGAGLTQGRYRMYITDAGELKQVARSETLTNENGQKLDILYTWDVRLTKGGQPDPKLFVVK